MIDLEDFEHYQQIHQEIEKQDLSKEEIESKYIEEIERIKAEFKEKLEKETQQAYKKGYEDAANEYKILLQKSVKENVEKALKEKEKDIQAIYNEFNSLYKEMSKKTNLIFSQIQDLIIDSLSEIMQFLYISPQNEEFIIKQIEKILLEYKKAVNIEIKVHPEMKEKLKNVFPNVEIETDENLVKGDFIIEVSNLQIENKIKEKLEVMKNEIKREIQKLT